METGRPPAPEVPVTKLPRVPSGRFADSLRAFKHRNYRLYYPGIAISQIGTWMQLVAQAWLVLEITDSRVALGVVTMLQFLPITLLVLFAGVIADRVPKRKLLMATQVLAMLQAIVLAALVATDSIELWHIYILALMLGLANAFELPTRQAFAIEMVGRDDLINALALNSSTFNGARLIGPAIGGFIIAGAGVEGVFAINALTYVPILGGLAMMRMDEMFASERRPGRNPLAELREGIVYVITTPATRLVVILVALIGMFGYNFSVVLPLLAKYVLDGDSVALGFLLAATGLGALIATLFLAGRKAATHTQLFSGAIAFTILLTGVALSTNLYVTIVLLIGLGGASAVFGTTANVALQIATPDHLRGRVVSVFMLLFAGSTPVGGYLTGVMAEHFGTQTAVGVLASMCGLGVALGALYFVTNRAAVKESGDATSPAPVSAG